MRDKLTYANVMVTILAFIVLGGGAYAATHLKKNSVTSKAIRNGQVKRIDLATNAVVSSKVKDGSLLSGDFKAGQLTAGAAMEWHNWCGGEGCPNALQLTNLGIETNLLTLQRPDGGAPPWQKTIATATLSYYNAGDPDQLHCRINGQGPGFAIMDHGAGGTMSFTVPAVDQGPVQLFCMPSNPTTPSTVDVRINEATLSLIPASYVHP